MQTESFIAIPCDSLRLFENQALLHSDVYGSKSIPSFTIPFFLLIHSKIPPMRHNIPFLLIDHLISLFVILSLTFSFFT